MAAFGRPEDLVGLCFFRKIELADGKRGNRQFVKEMDADDGKQGKSPPHRQPMARSDHIKRPSTISREGGSNIVLTAFLA